MIKEILNNKRVGHISSGKFSISGINCCKRKKFMELKGEFKSEYDERTKRIFRWGDFIHRETVSELMEKVPPFGYEIAAAEINIPDNEYLSGRVDCILSNKENGEKYVLDFKSAGSWTFNKVKQGQCSQDYKDQVNMYMHLLGIHKGFLIFISKDKSEVEEVEVVYNKERAEKQIQEVKLFFEENVKPNIAPEKCDGGQFGCKCCYPDTPFNKPIK